MMRIALICRSIRPDSFTKKVLRKIEGKLEAAGIEIDFIDFSTDPLEIFDRTNQDTDEARSFIYRKALVDGILIACPEYHNSFTGVLKNAFDYLSSDQLAEKPIVLLATSGGGKGGISRLNGMGLFLRGMYGLVLPNQTVINRSDTVDSESLAGALTIAQNVVNYSRLLKVENAVVN